nr:MAG TPA_asm: hypothetical protein [Caudoviricetes sp.]
MQGSNISVYKKSAVCFNKHLILTLQMSYLMRFSCLIMFANSYIFTTLTAV